MSTNDSAHHVVAGSGEVEELVLEMLRPDAEMRNQLLAEFVATDVVALQSATAIICCDFKNTFPPKNCQHCGIYGPNTTNFATDLSM
jgi:hypothetical protein